MASELQVAMSRIGLGTFLPLRPSMEVGLIVQPVINSSSLIDFAMVRFLVSESFSSKVSGDFNSDLDLVVVTHPSFLVTPYLSGLLTW